MSLTSGASTRVSVAQLLAALLRRNCRAPSICLYSQSSLQSGVDGSVTGQGFKRCALQRHRALRLLMTASVTFQTRPSATDKAAVHLIYSTLIYLRIMNRWTSSVVLELRLEPPPQAANVKNKISFIIINKMASSALKNLVVLTFCFLNGLANIKLLCSLPATKSIAGLRMRD